MAWKGPAPKFRESLRLNNLYPTLPPTKFKEEKQPLYEQFKREMGALNRIGDAPALMGQTEYSPEYQPATHPIDRNALNVQFNEGNIGETARAMSAAKTGYGIDLNKNALSPYQYGQLANKDRDLDIREQNLLANQGLAGQKIAETDEMNAWKRANPGGKLVHQPDGSILQVGPGGEIMGNFGPSGKMAEERKIGLENTNRLGQINAQGRNAQGLETTRQTGRVALGEQAGQRNLAEIAAKAAVTPLGSKSSTDYRTDAAGNVIGQDTTRRNIMPPGSVRGNAAIMYGPDGIPRTIPIDQTDDAQEKYGMTFKKPGTR